MSTIPPFHIGYADDANRRSRNASFAAWVIFSPSNESLDSGGIFLGHATSNIAKYEVVITLISNASTLGILSLVVQLDSNLIISHLTSHYSICNPMLYQKYLRVRLFEHSFDAISYEDIPREFNVLVDSLANEILDWNLSH